MIGNHSAILTMGNHSRQHMCIFHYTSLEVQKVQLTLCKAEFSFSFCLCHRAMDLLVPVTIGPYGNHPKINPAHANLFKTGRISESCRKT